MTIHLISHPRIRTQAALASIACLCLTACPDEGIVDPFGQGDTGESSSSGPGGDDGQTSMTTQPGDGSSTGEPGTGSSTTGMVDPTLDGTSSTGGPSDESSTGMGDGSSSSGGDESGSSSTGGGGMTTPCPVEMIDVIPFSYDDSITGEADEFTGSCGGGGAPDHAYTLVAPGDGFYVFDTFGSSFDTVLYVLDGDCGGTQLACNDDSGFGTQSEVSVPLTAGETITIVVDSFGLAGGNYTLNGTFFGGTCPDGDIGNAVPQSTMGDTSVGDNTTSGSCGGGIAFDDSYTFTAPADGVYVFDTVGSAFDTVLYAFADDCAGAEIVCNDDLSAMSTDSRIYADMAAGEEIVVVVDGAAAESGAWTLNVGQHACPAEDLGTTAPQSSGGTTTGLPNVLSGTCGGGGAPEIGLLFEAPVDGTYVIDTNGSAFDTVLYVLDGPGCAGNQLGCNDDTGGAQSQVVIDLAAGQQVSIMVDGFGAASGNYALNIGVIAGSCPDADLGNTVPQTVNGDTSAGDNAGGGTCGGLGGNDDNWTFTAPNDGVFVFDTVGSVTDTILYVLDGDCNGAELGCNDDAAGTASALTVPLAMGQDVVVVVDGDGIGGAYTLNVSEDICPDQDIGNMSPFTTMGTTAGASNTLEPATCAFSNAPDLAFLWEAPAAGMYTFDTDGSAFDTVLYVLDGATCGGPEIACDDDGGVGLQSQVTVNLAAGQQIIIVVDGYSTNSGDYVLDIN